MIYSCTLTLQTQWGGLLNIFSIVIETLINLQQVTVTLSTDLKQMHKSNDGKHMII